MVIVAVRHALLRVDILPEGRVEISALQIVHRKRIARQQAVHIAVLDHLLHGRARPGVERKRRAHHPHNAAVLPLVAQQADKRIVIARVGGFAAASLAEHKFLVRPRSGLRKAPGVHKNALRAILGAPEGGAVAFFQITHLHNAQRAGCIQNDMTVHAAFFCKAPCAADFKVFREHGRAVEILRRHTVLFADAPRGIRRGAQLFRRKIRRMVLRQLKFHRAFLPGGMVLCLLFYVITYNVMQFYRGIFF